MAEYKSRRERRHAQGGKIGTGKAPSAIALIIGLGKKPKKKDGGTVEGEKARHHLGKRARGGATDEPRKIKQLDAREAALSSDGVDKVAEGSHREEREVPEQERDDDAPDRVDDFYLKTNSGKIDPKQMYLARPSKFGADEDYRRARGGRANGGAADDDDGPDNNLKSDPGVGGYAQRFSVNQDTGEKTRDGPIKPLRPRPITLEEFNRDDKPRYDAKKFEVDDPRMPKKASGGWIGPAREKMERKGTVGSLHKALHVSEGKRIPTKRLEEARKDAGPALREKIQFAENVRK